MNAFDYFFQNTAHLDKLFLIGPKETISYKDLYDRSVKLASYFADHFSNQNILILAPNSLYFITVYLAIIKSGNVAVPLNQETEQDNFEYIQHLCHSNLVITTSQILKKLVFNNISTLNEVEVNDLIKYVSSEQQKKHIETESDPDQLAEIIFTSGSTGKPKGVMITHKNLIANTFSIIEYLKLSGKDTMLVVLPFYYCYGLSLLHTHLRVGGSIVLNNLFAMLGTVINDLKRFNCTGFAGVPTHYQMLLRKSESFKGMDFPCLRYVTQAGGRLNNIFITEFTEAFPGVEFIVMYGQTEATARLCWLPYNKLKEKIGSCGKAIPGVQIKITNDQCIEVKPWQVGEILAHGDNIMQGYYKDEASTIAALKNGWLKTGDIGYIDEEGYVFLTARKKEIIKVGGRRISPKEIEEIIVLMPDVIDCTIEGISDDILGEAMKATVVVKKSGKETITSDAIKAWCALKLSSYKVPQVIEIKDTMSISATGKKIKNRN